MLRRQGYDGKKVDVWASGVLLFVMLLGMFPFEMEDENYVNTAGMYSIWWVCCRDSLE
jgi:serine/threonine-protein kinase SRK2